MKYQETMTFDAVLDGFDFEEYCLKLQCVEQAQIVMSRDGWRERDFKFSTSRQTRDIGAGVSRINEREAALISFSDLFSTIVEMTGTPLAQIHDSFSFFPLLSATGEGQRDCAYTEVVMEIPMVGLLEMPLINTSSWIMVGCVFTILSMTLTNKIIYCPIQIKRNRPLLIN